MVREKILASWEARQSPPRPHLGASQIGNDCNRALWYSFRWAVWPHFDGRTLRLFDRGQREEAVFVEELRRIGARVLDVNPKTGKQFSIAHFGGHFSGSADGVITQLADPALGIEYNEWLLLEFKTHSAKSFADLNKKGLRDSKPMHFDQMQVYMDGLRLSSGLYLAVCKNTDDLYVERVDLDPAHAARLIDKAGRIIATDKPPERMTENPTYYACKFCDYAPVCHGGEFPEVSCRTCAFATCLPDSGTWQCGKHAKPLTYDMQLDACDDHLFLPPAVSYEAIDSTDTSVTYRIGGELEVINGTGGYTSRELRENGHALMDESMKKAVDTLKAAFQ